MKIIKTKVIGDTITPIEQGYVIENQVNQYAIEFDFDETWNFQEKYCIFQDEFEEQTFKRPILANQVIVPSELLNGRITIQVYGQNIEDNVITNRQPSLKYVFSILNSLPTNASEEQDTPTPTQWEIYISQIEEMCNDLQDQFDDLKEDCEQKCDDVIERLGEAEQDIQTNTDNIRTNAENIDKLNNDLLDYSLITETGNKISMSINPNTYVITLSLKDKNNNVLSTQSVDLPLETMIVSASYSNGVLTFTLKNGQTLQVPIGDLISGLVSTDTFNEAVQGLSNRITTIENDYLKASDKTELQNQITANADDIDDIQEEQLTQNADIESLQQENERLSRIVEGLPTKQANGTSFVLNDMVKANIKDYQLRGNTIQDGTPTPDSPIAIQTATGNQIINVCGKNILNISSISSFNGITNTINQDGTITSSGLPNSSWQVYATIELDDYIDNGKTYTISQTAASRKMYLQVNEINKSDSSVHQRYYLTTNQSTSFVANKDLYTYKAYIQNGDTSYWESTSQTITQYYQIELNNSATSYEKFTQQTKTISLGNIELNKIGDYQDKIYKQGNKWYLHKETGSKLFNGTTNVFTNYNHSESNDRLTLNLPSRRISGYYTQQNKDYILCSHLQNVGQPANPQVNTILAWNNDTNECFAYFESGKFTSLQNANQWLQENNMYIKYVLKNSTDTEITDTSLISQLEDILNIILNENNTIIVNGNLPSDTLIIGYADISKLIASLSSQDNRSVDTRKGGNIEEPKEPIEEPIETKEEER